MKKYTAFVFIISLLLVFSCTDKTKDTIEEKIVLNKYGINTDTLIESVGTVQQNETLGEIFESYGIGYQTVLNVVEASKDTFDLRKIRKGNNFSFYFTDDSLRSLKHFVYEIDQVNYVFYDISDSIKVWTGIKPTEVTERNVSGVINNSLWQTMQDIDVNPSLAIELSEVFAWQINFYGIQAGDRFKVLFKEAYVDSQFVGIKEIGAAEFIHKGNVYTAIRFFQNGHVEYFDTCGLSLQKQFLKTPLKFSRISSGFNPNRLHPVLKYRRPHLGVDFAAPRGTPVHAIGDGEVIFRGRKNEPGNFIKIRHNGTYTSGYMHLSKFATGIVVGKQVKQGDVIGYVGSTGLASGPHLDLRFWKNGRPVNYLTQEFPATHPISEKNKTEFKSVVENDLQELGKVQYPSGEETKNL